jgi:hypothetical protein
MKSAEYSSTRQELIQWISSLNDTSLLNFLNSLRMSRKKNNKDWWEQLSESDKKNIELGLKDLQEGKVISSEEFWKRLANA